jgi:formylglycine-generating enzyme required for sulfatase activity
MGSFSLSRQFLRQPFLIFTGFLFACFCFVCFLIAGFFFCSMVFSSDRAAKPMGRVAKTLDLGGGVTMDLIYIKPGTFKMGSSSSEIDKVVKDYDYKKIYIEDEGPQTTVTFTKELWMGKTEVTQAQWRAVMGSDSSNLYFKGNDNNPVEEVSWYECMEFCEKLSTRAGVEVTLPTEAQWEYACRAGTTTRSSFGDSDSQLGDYAWYYGNSDRKTHPVGAKKPNAFGFYDMNGNVYEWCLDWYGDYPGGSAKDYAGKNTGSNRVIRGGGWSQPAVECRSADRHKFTPIYRFNYVGFRVVIPVSVAQSESTTNDGPGLTAISSDNVETPTSRPTQTLKESTPGAIKPLDLGSEVTMDLVYIKPGTFKMGSSSSEIDKVVKDYDYKKIYIGDEGPQTVVILTKGFWMGKTEVTQAQWRAVMGTTVQQQRDEADPNGPIRGEGDHNPMYWVSWDECMEFCTKLSSKTGLNITLPTGAQWEYACRAGTTTRFSFGDSDSLLGDYAWYDDNSDSKTHPVGAKKPNAFGLYDMHGNVGEWCLDLHGDYPGGSAKDYTSKYTGSFRVCRGGCWIINGGHCRSASRYRVSPHYEHDSLGFRVVSFSSPN